MKKTTSKQTNQLLASSTTNLLLASVSLSMEEVDKTISALKKHPERDAEIIDVLYKHLLISKKITKMNELEESIKTRVEEWSLKYGTLSMSQYAFLSKVYGIAVGELMKTQINPKLLYDLLSCFVIGQEDYKRKLAIAFNIHLMKNNAKSQYEDLPKSSLLVCGPSGSGKTFAVQTLSKFFHKPVVIINCNSVVPVGIVGTTIPNHFTSLLVKGHSPKDLEECLVILDEFDKILQSPLYNLALQNELLCLCDDCGEIKCRVDFNYNSEVVSIPTKNMMFVFTGVFDGIKKIKKGNSLGFGHHKVESDSCHLGPTDLVEYGVKPEIVGRIQNYTMLDSLTIDDFLNVLNAPLESPIIDYQNYFKQQGVKLDVKDEAKRYMAELAYNRKLGVRGLKGLLNEILSEAMFSLSSDNVEISCDYINEHINQ